MKSSYGRDRGRCAEGNVSQMQCVQVMYVPGCCTTYTDTLWPRPLKVPDPVKGVT